MKKRIFALVLIIALFLPLLSACGDSEKLIPINSENLDDYFIIETNVSLRPVADKWAADMGFKYPVVTVEVKERNHTSIDGSIFYINDVNDVVFDVTVYIEQENGINQPSVTVSVDIVSNKPLDFSRFLSMFIILKQL